VTPAPVRWHVLVYLRGAEDPMVLDYASREAATEAVGYVTMTWLRFPPEARPASCWVVQNARVETTIDPTGVGEKPVTTAYAAIDPREIQAVQVAGWRSRSRAHQVGEDA